MSPANKLVAASLLFAFASLCTFLMVYTQQRSAPTASAQTTPVVTATSIAWEASPERGFELARQTRKPMMIVFYTDWCPSCKVLDSNALKAPAVIGESQKFVNLRINAEQRRDYAGQFGINSYPTVVFFDPAGSVLNRFSGAYSPSELLIEMNTARQRMAGA